VKISIAKWQINYVNDSRDEQCIAFFEKPSRNWIRVRLVVGTVDTISHRSPRGVSRDRWKKQVRQQDTYPTNAVKTMCNTPLPFSKATFPSLTVRLYLLVSRDREWCLRHSFKHNFGLLWPWPLTSWPLRATVHAFAPEENLCPFALKSVHSFTKYNVHKLVTDKRTNGRTKGQVENIMHLGSV